MNKTYEAVMSRQNKILKEAVGLDYSTFELAGIGFDYEMMMSKAGYSISEVRDIQKEHGVGNTPLLELKNITKLARKNAKQGYGARIFIKDEATNPSGSFKARRAAISAYHAKKLGYKGLLAATSGNYGAAVASQAAMHGLKSIIVQECFDSQEIGQPEIVEKARKCEAFGAEVVQLTVGPELFYTAISLLEDTKFFNASLYTPFGISGVETLGFELAEQCLELTGKYPEKVVCTNAGGGNLTGTARGLKKAGAEMTNVVAASVDLSGLHMASDSDFNKKSFTTGHTGFGIPFTTKPDRVDVPRNAARPLRYMDRYVLVTQGQVFYTTEMLAQLEGLERGPAGNTSLAAAFVLAQEMPEDEIIIVQETEYTGAGKHIQPQLSFAKKQGINVYLGNPQEEVPGTSIVLPKSPNLCQIKEVEMAKLRKSYLKHNVPNDIRSSLTELDYKYLSEETKLSIDEIREIIESEV